ncbi:polysaccharide deacetylase family protein [Rhizobium sp. RHZ02]|uniref:polysaccharide deacetylase family protein n=1 Tax=Rhizobium sp. RHZ02 TaxID=2769306 RepID=UPI0017842687|nr:polysaccharide deacetylase family protein [Rhizobium sp. RHZ02]MBD9453467.1 polysaccharide deacetylase family protein [Rhizobium sp. RHZ02]
MKRRILTFHGIGEPERVLDHGEADYWISLDRFCDILDRVSHHVDRDKFLITFDDGNLSDLRLAAPELCRRDLGAEFFVLTGRFDKTGSLDRNDVRCLLKMGMRIGSHGIDHRDWSSLPDFELTRELGQSKRLLEEICGHRLHSASIPFGRYNRATLAKLRACGYETAYSSDGGDTTLGRFLQARTSIRRNMTDAMIEQILDGYLPAGRRLRRAVRMIKMMSKGVV